MSTKKASSSATPPSLKDLVQTYSGNGKQFTVKILGFQDIETKPGQYVASSFAAFKTLRVAVKQTKAHKTRGVLRLTLRELSMYNEQDKSVSKVPMGKVIFVNCDPEDAKVFGVIVRFKDSPSGYRFFAFKADLKITISFVRSAQEVFKTLVRVRKVKEQLKKKKESEAQNSTAGAGNTDVPELEDDDHLYASIEDLNISEPLTRLRSFQQQKEASGHHYFTIIPPTSAVDPTDADDNYAYASISHQGWAVNWPSQPAAGSKSSTSDTGQSLWASFEDPQAYDRQAKDQAVDLIDDDFPIYAVPHKKSMRPVPPSPPPEMEDDGDFGALDAIPPPIPPQTAFVLLDAFSQPLSAAESTPVNDSASGWTLDFTNFQDSTSQVCEDNSFEVDWSQLSRSDQPNLPERNPDATTSAWRTFPLLSVTNDADINVQISGSSSVPTSSALDSFQESLGAWPGTVAMQSPKVQCEENPYDMVADDPPEFLESEKNSHQEVEVHILSPLPSVIQSLPESLDALLGTPTLQPPSMHHRENPYDMIADDPPELLEPEENSHQEVEVPTLSPLPSVIQSLPESLDALLRTPTLQPPSVHRRENPYDMVADDPPELLEPEENSHQEIEVPTLPLLPCVIESLPGSLDTRLETAALQLPNLQGEEKPYDTVADDPPEDQLQSAENSHQPGGVPTSALLPSIENGNAYEQIAYNPPEKLDQQQEPGPLLSRHPALPNKTPSRSNWHTFPASTSGLTTSGLKSPQVEQNPAKQSPAVITTADKSVSLAPHTRPVPPPPRRGHSSVEAVAAKMKGQRGNVLPRKKPARPTPPLLPKPYGKQAPRVDRLPENLGLAWEQKPQSQQKADGVARQVERLSSPQVQQLNQTHASQHRLAPAQVRQRPARPPRPKLSLINRETTPTLPKNDSGIVEHMQSAAHPQYQSEQLMNEKGPTHALAVASQEKYQSSGSPSVQPMLQGRENTHTLSDVGPSLPLSGLPRPELSALHDISPVVHPSDTTTSFFPSLEFPSISDELLSNSLPPLSTEVDSESISVTLPGLLTEPLPEFDLNAFSLPLPEFSSNSFPEPLPEMLPSELESTMSIPVLSPSLPELSLPVDLPPPQDSITKEPQPFQSPTVHKSDIQLEGSVVSVPAPAVSCFGVTDGNTEQEVPPPSSERNDSHEEFHTGARALQIHSQQSFDNSITASNFETPEASPVPSSASIPMTNQKSVCDHKESALVEEVGSAHGDTRSMKVSQSEGDLSQSVISTSVSSQSLRTSSTKKEERKWPTLGRINMAVQPADKQKNQKKRNREKCLKSLKQFPLREGMEPLFNVEMIETHLKTKDHLPVSRGERLSILLAEHPKLPMGKYIAEKEDGTIGYINEGITWVVDGDSSDDSFDDSFDEDSYIPTSTVAGNSLHKMSLLSHSPGKHSVPKRPAPPPPPPPYNRQTRSLPSKISSEPEAAVTLASSAASAKTDATTPPPPPPPSLPPLPWS